MLLVIGLKVPEALPCGKFCIAALITSFISFMTMKRLDSATVCFQTVAESSLVIANSLSFRYSLQAIQNMTFLFSFLSTFFFSLD